MRKLNVFVSLSKENLRSKMLKKVMPKLSGERGKKLELAFENNDVDEIQKIMQTITKELSTPDPDRVQPKK